MPPNPTHSLFCFILSSLVFHMNHFFFIGLFLVELEHRAISLVFYTFKIESKAACKMESCRGTVQPTKQLYTIYNNLEQAVA